LANLIPSLVSAIALTFVLSTGSLPALADDLLLYEPFEKGAKSRSVKVAGELEEQFYRRGVRFQDAELQAILDRVAERVVPPVSDSYINWRVYMIRHPSPRLFSLSDGQIYVHTGLLARLDNEAQLAAVIAHEAHHVAAHHRIEEEIDGRNKDLIKGGLTMLISNSDGFDYEAMAQGLTDLSFFAEIEFETDAAAVALLARAGYPPAAAIDALNNMRSDSKMTLAQRKGAFDTSGGFIGVDDRELASLRANPAAALSENSEAYDTNASLVERVGRLQRTVGELPRLAVGPGIVASRPLQLRRVIEMTIDDYIRLNEPATALRLVDSMIADQPDAFLFSAKGDAHLALGPRPSIGNATPDFKFEFKIGPDTYKEETAAFLASEGGPEWLARNLQSAEEAYLAAMELDESFARSYRGLGNLYFEQDDYRPAGRNYIQYLKLETDKMERTFVIERLQFIKAELGKQKEEDQ
jgi:tetratricopeptide (TPR) repeat protein